VWNGLPILKNSLVIRKEHTGDEEYIYFVNDQAFDRCDEADVVDKLRDKNKLQLSLVAEIDKKIVGHIAFTRVSIPGTHHGIQGLGLAPMAVLKEYQNRRIGTALIHEGLKQCEELGMDFVVVLGYPKYYSRFGFQKASLFVIHFIYNIPEEAFMIMELKKGAIRSIANQTIKYEPEFDCV
jgi:putative acetyltransferase